MGDLKIDLKFGSKAHFESDPIARYQHNDEKR